MKKVQRRERLIGVTQTQRSLDALLNRVKQGYSFRIRRRGRPDARLAAVSTTPRSR